MTATSDAPTAARTPDQRDQRELAWIRRRFFGTGFLRSFISITLGGALIAAIGAALGTVA